MSRLMTDSFTYQSRKSILSRYFSYRLILSIRMKCLNIPSSYQYSERAVKTVFFTSLLLLFWLSGVRSIEGRCMFYSKYIDWEFTVDCKIKFSRKYIHSNTFKSSMY